MLAIILMIHVLMLLKCMLGACYHYNKLQIDAMKVDLKNLSIENILIAALFHNVY